jgi:putative iron-regulated protein
MKKFIFLAALGLFWASCDKQTTITTQVDYSGLLTNITNEVIVPTYRDLYLATQSLVVALQTLEQNPTAINLEAARQAWRNTRMPWEQSEGFLFGPVEQQGIDPSLDSWPVNQPDLDNVLSGSQTLNKTYIDQLAGTLKGSHTIEYLLFGIAGNKQLANFTAREYEYLFACAESYNGDAQRLYYGWTTNGVNYGVHLTEAGKAGNLYYPSQKSALQEILNGMITIADEVANGKIQEPYIQQNLTLEESRFSANSKADFANNIRSIQNAYTGKYGINTQGEGIGKVIADKNAELNTRITQQIQTAITAIENIQGTFTYAVNNARPSILTAQTEVRNLLQLLQDDAQQIVNGL